MHDLEQLVLTLEHLRGNTQPGVTTQSVHSGKCGLGLWFAVQEHWNNFSSSQKQRIQTALAQPEQQKNRVVGNFRIFYDTTGANKPSLIAFSSIDSAYHPIDNTVEQYVDSVGKIFNYVWSYEIGTLGYTAPPVPPDGKYRVFITDFVERGLYGRTTPDVLVSSPSAVPPRWSTFIEIDNDFMEDWFGTSRGIPGLQVTAAHEFHHAIQIGSYGAWGSTDAYFYEITSTWMEDVVYTDVNDYYQSLSNDPVRSSQFSHPELGFKLSDLSIEYSRAIWGKYIEKRFSRDLMKHTWEYMRQVSSVPALDNALADVGSSFRNAFLEFSYWNYFTGENADTVKYYTEGKHYPTMSTRPERIYAAPTLLFDDNLQAISSLYQPIHLPGGNMLTIISNINTSSGYPPESFGFSYSLSASETAGSKHLSNGLYSKIINVPDPSNWSTQDTVPTIVTDVLVFPNPFIPKGNKPITFHLPQTNQGTATVSIFSSSFNLFFSGELPVKPFELVIEWNGHDERRNTIPSGIYFYVINVDNKQYVGKFAVIQ